ncbi:MAG: hypothetical protein JWM28_3496 [Chitinophagaceae bacterium]|nr:hypothetical protein [Chitinophagaceae bacterium]
MAVINVGSGEVDVLTMTNAPQPYSIGMVTLGDGYLYLSAFDKINQLDPATMIVKKAPYFDFNKPDSINFTGLSNYAEHCNAPVCHASLSIENLSALSYCSGAGVSLKANGTGIRAQLYMNGYYLMAIL